VKKKSGDHAGRVYDKSHPRENNENDERLLVSNKSNNEESEGSSCKQAGKEKPRQTRRSLAREAVRS
jgi:hypothetical protein